MSGSVDATQSDVMQQASWLRRLSGDERGATAVEFAMVIGPFLMMLMGIIGIGLYFFTTFSLENAVERASRIIRTGQAQQQTSPAFTAADFKTQVCNLMPGFADCTNGLQVNVQNYASSASITSTTIPKCLTAGGALNSTPAYSTGGSNEIVLVLACYEWTMAKYLPFFSFGNMASGSMLIQAATTFRTEPYSN